MHRVEPKVYLIGETKIVEEGLQEYLNDIGVPDWTSDAVTDGEKLIEVYGRLCYRSFEPGLNKNVTKVREGNKPYIGNILNVGHGSVTEHTSLNFIFHNVSRIFTHELVRHRAGTAISQESLRFVRLDDLGMWLPTCIQDDGEAATIYANTFEQLEKLQTYLANHYKLDDPGVPFHYKKEITSAMRRLAPEGLSTTIGWSGNIRAIRWLLNLRTSGAAEEELRVAISKLGDIVIPRYPSAFQDFEVEMINGIKCYKAANQKV